MIFILIYKITNTINNKIYVGKTTTSLKQRFNEHCKFAKLNKHSTHLANAIRKYGKENFKIEKIDEANSISELNLKEKYWIKRLDAVNSGYNLTAGGDGGNTYECKTDEEMNDIKNKIRVSKMSGDNPHSKLVKCKNVITNEEIIFNSFVDCQKYFNEKSHNFITRRCTHRTKYVYDNQWIFAYENNEFINDYTFEKNSNRKRMVKIINTNDNKEYIFDSYTNAEKFFKLKKGFFSSKAYKHKEKEFWEKSHFKIFVLE